MSAALRDIIFIMQVVTALISFGVNLVTVLPVPTVKCKLFEGTIGAIQLVKAPHMYPQTKHIDIQYKHHHFREAIRESYLFPSPEDSRINFGFSTKTY